MMKDFFRLAENQSSVRTEVMAGITTFLTMAYIIFLQPAILSGTMFGVETGMDFGAVMTATCLSAALATIIMALYARYPIAQAPGMGENFFFVFTIIPAAAAAGFESPWRVALGVVFISGVLFLLISLLKIRNVLIDTMSPSMKNGIAAGIGLFITFIGFQNAHVIIKDPGTAVKLNAHFLSPDVMVFFFGMVLTAALYSRRVRGAILLGILGSTCFAVAVRAAIGLSPALANSLPVAGSGMLTQFTITHQLVSAPPSLAPTLFKMDLANALSIGMIPFIIILLVMDTFDTIGTLIGVSEQAGFMKDNKLPRASEALVSDAIGTVAGACMGTSTVTSFIESAAGVEQGGRTGLTGLVTATLFLIVLFFSPVVKMIGSYAPITAPALVIVGSMMMQNALKIDWGDYSESIPAFLVMIGIPLTYSIADGLALGFISYPVIKIFGGRRRDIGWVSIVTSILLLLYMMFLRPKA